MTDKTLPLTIAPDGEEFGCAETCSVCCEGKEYPDPDSGLIDTRKGTMRGVRFHSKERTLSDASPPRFIGFRSSQVIFDPMTGVSPDAKIILICRLTTAERDALARRD